jgi:hypothetical protein
MTATSFVNVGQACSESPHTIAIRACGDAGTDRAIDIAATTKPSA